MGGRKYTRRICPICLVQVVTHDELTLAEHIAKGGERCEGSNLSVHGLRQVGVIPSFEVDPRTGFAPFSKEVCVVCGDVVAVDSLSFFVFPHLTPGDKGKCAASGKPYKGHNHKKSPISNPAVCPECGQKVKYGRKRGQIYSHNLPGTTDVCNASGKIIGDEEGGTIEAFNDSKLHKTSEVKPLDLNYVDSVSVRAVSAGLPGSKRR